MGRSPKRPGARDVHGILLLDKPAGLSSNQAMQQARRALNARKAGHTGNLDMAATGLLPICLGEATKFSGVLLDADKTYRATIRFGVTTTTGDSEGEVTARHSVDGLTTERVRSMMASFIGGISQVPPMYSALKRGGKPLYVLARRGESVARAPRSVWVHRFALCSFHDAVADVEVECSKGTYIRTLAEDLGEALGCGAHLTALRRLRSGPFDLTDATDLPGVAEACLRGRGDALVLPIDSALLGLPQVTVDASHETSIRHGQSVTLEPAGGAGIVRLYGPSARFLGLGEWLEDGRLHPRRLVQWDVSSEQLP